MKRKFKFRFIYIVFIVVAIFLCFVVKNKFTTKQEEPIETVATVIIDPGHGGIDGGTVGSDDTLEKDLALTISKKIGAAITELDPSIEVLYTRDDDNVDAEDEIKNLQDRIDFAKENNGDYFLSIHFNALGDESVYGYVGYAKKNDKANKTIYKYISSNFDEIDYSTDLNLRPVEENPLQVITDNPVPGLLLEVGFMTNEEELKTCTDESTQDEIALAIAKAYVKYIQENPSK